MMSSGRGRTASEMKFCVQSTLPAVDVLPDEALPLLKRASAACARSDFEMAPVHVPAQRYSDATVCHGSSAHGSNASTKLLSCRTPRRMNVIEALQTFWQKKLMNSSLECQADKAQICYTCEPREQLPFMCYVTLPNGCCFGNLLNDCSDGVEARRSAAHVALVNSLYNELPCRKIDDILIDSAIQEAKCANRLSHTESSDDLKGLNVFRSILESTRGQTMLDYASLANQLLAMHWSGALEAMRRHGATRIQVLQAASDRHWFSEDSISEIALTWISNERQQPGAIQTELQQAMLELEMAQRNGRELAFPRLKRDILRLAASQIGT